MGIGITAMAFSSLYICDYESYFLFSDHLEKYVSQQGDIDPRPLNLFSLRNFINESTIN